MNKVLCLLVISTSFIFGGCNNQMYSWKGYNEKLLAYYKQHDPDKFIKSLNSIIKSGEGSNRVPPGIYGELGYLYYESGSGDLAIEFFKKEKSTWPESTFIMDKMIRNSKNL